MRNTLKLFQGDVKDAEWIADLLRHGLLNGSFIPDRGQRELKEIIRYRRSMVQERARELNRIQTVLEGANVKLSSVVSEINGKSSREMLDMLAAGCNDVKAMAGKARMQMRKKIPQLEEALHGFIAEHQRLMLRLMLKNIDTLDAQILELDQEIRKKMEPVSEQLQLVDSIPGIGERSAQVIIAEIGTNMNQFLQLLILPHGLDCAPAAMKAPANAKAERPAREAISSDLL